MPAWEAYLYATGVIVGSLLYTVTSHPYFFECYHYGMKLRIATCYLIYKKVNFYILLYKVFYKLTSKLLIYEFAVLTVEPKGSN